MLLAQFASKKPARASMERSPTFLVLGLGFSENYSIHAEHAPKILCTLHQPNASIQRVMLLEDERDERREWPRANNERLLIRLNRKRSPKNIATRIINSVQALFAHFQRVAVGMEDFGIYRIPRRGLIRNRAILTKELISLEKTARQFGYHDEMFIARLGSYTVVPESVMAYLFFFLPFTLASRALFDACHFFDACSSQYNFIGDVVTEILHDPEGSPETEQERLRLENVVLSGYRTVEALVGEPGREPRFRARLQAFGIDFDEPVGFHGYPKMPLGRRIYWLQTIRDEAAAHGQRRRRTPLSFFEAMEAQELADSVLHKALWHGASVRGRREGPRSETAYFT